MVEKYEKALAKAKNFLSPLVVGRGFSGDRIFDGYASDIPKYIVLPVKYSDGEVYLCKCEFMSSTTCRALTMFLAAAKVGNIVPSVGPEGGDRLGIEGQGIVPELHIYRRPG